MLYPPKVRVEYIDVSTYVPGQSGPVTLNLPRVGPKQMMVDLVPSIRRIQWYQFWRWHLIPRYNRELKKNYLTFLEIFGKPNE